HGHSSRSRPTSFVGPRTDGSSGSDGAAMARFSTMEITASAADGAGRRTMTAEVGLMLPSRDGRPSRSGQLPRRRTDHVEDAAAWLVAAIALFVLLLAIWGGAAVHADALDHSRLQYAQRTQVEAVLLDDPPPGYRAAD